MAGSNEIKTLIQQAVAENRVVTDLLKQLVDVYGYIDPDLIPAIAESFNLSRAEILGVISFYDDFRTDKPAKHVVRICQAEACQAVGANKLMSKIQARVERLPASHEVEIQTVSCLGLCACGPAVIHNNTLHARFNDNNLDALLASTADARFSVSDSVCEENRSTRILYVPLDSVSISLGADKVVAAVEEQALLRSINVRIIRNGTRGMVWAEPLLEVQTPRGRIGYSCVTPELIRELFESGFLDEIPVNETGTSKHPNYMGLIDEIPWLKNQTRMTFSRCGITDPLCITDYRAHGGLTSLSSALSLQPIELVEAISASGLRGRGGAAFPAGIKWRTVHECTSTAKYIVCNADEGDSGTFADRMIMEGDPFLLIEGMIIAAYATGASKGYIYLRSEYPVAQKILRKALVTAEQENLLGDNILGSGFDFTIQLFIGAGAYICGEETALLESLEGRRGEVRSKPPLPAHEGLFGSPTLIHNVISLCSVPAAIRDAGQHYANQGINKSLGTLPFQLAGNIRCGGLVELPFGMSLRALLDDFGQGTLSGKPRRAVQIGGPLGAYLPDKMLDTPLDYEAFIQIGAGIGHGGIVVFDDSVNLKKQACYAFQFCVEESCGKCTPCRIGSRRGVEHIEHAGNLKLIEELCEVMEDGSLCAMGGMTPVPVRSAIKYFPEDFVENPVGISNTTEIDN